MDQGIGRILAALNQMGVADDTLILFLSDNGGTHEPATSETPDLETLGSDQSFHTYRRPWANASNVPFRLYKHWVHEGGISTPLIVHWPARIRDPGSLRSQVGHGIDRRPTALEGAGVDFVERVNESGFEIRPAARPPKVSGVPQGELAEKVKEVLDAQVNPAVSAHGGEIVLVDVKGSEIFIEMAGGCQGCALSRMTLKQGVERMVRQAVPEITAVHEVTDHTSGDNPFY